MANSKSRGEKRQKLVSADDLPIVVAPIHKDRRVEILMLGLMGKSDEAVREKLKAEGLDAQLPENYRTEQGELDLLWEWLPKKVGDRPEPDEKA